MSRRELVAIIAAIARPKVLVITPHPLIGAGIEMVLNLEGLYEVRRAGSLAEGIEAAERWPADAALIDGVLVDGAAFDPGVPSYVLSGDAASGEELSGRVTGARGWLPKDASPARLVSAIDDALGIVRLRGDARGTLGVFIAVLVIVLFIAALGLFVWRFFLS